MRDDRYFTGPELKPRAGGLDSNADLFYSQVSNYGDLVSKLVNDLREKPFKERPMVTTGTGWYAWGDGETPREMIGPPRIVINEGPPDYVNEPSPDPDWPYIDLDYEDRMAEPAYYDMYQIKRNHIYLGLLGNAIEDAGFREFIDFSVETNDPHFAKRLHLDITQDLITLPAYDIVEPHMHPVWEEDRSKFNSNVEILSRSFDEFVAKDSDGSFTEKEISWRNSSFINRLFHAVKVTKIKRSIDEKYLGPLAEASQKQAIEYTALEEAKRLAES